MGRWTPLAETNLWLELDHRGGTYLTSGHTYLTSGKKACLTSGDGQVDAAGGDQLVAGA
jgi:hypothetical protein